MARYIAVQPSQHAHEAYRQAVCLCGRLHRTPRAAARCAGPNRMLIGCYLHQERWEIRRCTPHSTWREVLAWEGRLTPEEEEQIWR